MNSGPIWRSLALGDVDAWATLFATAEQHEPTGEHIGHEELLDDLKDPRLPPDATTSAWQGDQMVAYALIRAQDEVDSVHHMRLEALIHPEHRDAQTARHLLGWVEETSARIHTAAFGRAEGEVQIFVHERQRWMAATVTGSGFRPARTFVDMAMDITDPVPAPPLSGDLRIVPFSQEYAEAARLARNDAFSEHWSSSDLVVDSWKHKIGATTFRPELSFLVRTPENEVVSFALTSHYPAEDNATGRKELFITDVGTREPWRRQGLSNALLRQVINAGYELGYQRANIDVDHSNESGALRLYTRLGFTIVQRWTTYVRRTRLEQ